RRADLVAGAAVDVDWRVEHPVLAADARPDGPGDRQVEAGFDFLELDRLRHQPGRGEQRLQSRAYFHCGAFGGPVPAHSQSAQGAVSARLRGIEPRGPCERGEPELAGRLPFREPREAIP